MSDTGNDRIAGIPAWKNVSVWGAAFVLFNLALIASAIVVDVATYNALTREDRWIENATALLFFLTALLLLATALRGGGGGGGGQPHGFMVSERSCFYSGPARKSVGGNVCSDSERPIFSLLSMFKTKPISITSRE